MIESKQAAREHMDILILGTAYPLRGGIAHYNALLAVYLGKRHHIQIITFKRQYPAFLFPGKTQQETGDAGIAVPSEQLVDSINPFNWIRIGFQLRRRLPDAVVFKYWLPFFGPCFGTICRIIKWRRPTRVIAVCDNVIPHERRIGDRVFTRYAFRPVDGFIVQSETVEKDLLGMVQNPLYRKVAHPVYEIFGSALPKKEARERLHLKKDRVLLFFGYVRPYKGLHTLIDAMKKVRQSLDVTLLVVGEFYDPEAAYRTHIAREGLDDVIRVVSDYVPNESVAEYFSAADVVVLPYLAATQSGIAQIAYNFGKPVIATNVGGLAETLIDGVSGLIVPPKSPDALAGAILDFYQKNLEPVFVEGVKKERQKYSWENLVSAIEELASTEST
jgi:glycosyltransferase involved in cell wall biosynthesis